ncbi:MAG: xanthine dehydrogenase accessory protein XdhC [Burkholderiales bacterium]
MSDWIHHLQRLRRDGAPSVLVTVASVKGSTPREPGAKMVVTQNETFGTIGGGRLEFNSIEQARRILEAPPESYGAQFIRFPLGPGLGQCCGGLVNVLFEMLRVPQPEWIGILTEVQRKNQACVVVSVANTRSTGNKLIVTLDGYSGGLGDSELEGEALQVAQEMLKPGKGARGPLLREIRDTGAETADTCAELLFEPVEANDFNIVLFGAGHVGKALVNVLSGLSCRITWVDGREEQFPRKLPDNVTIAGTDMHRFDVADAPPGSYFLVMTHSHALDFYLCGEILQRDDFQYFGLIGSRSKRAQFEKHLKREGVAPERLKRMTCPIGAIGISNKQPSAIAIAVAAEILQVYERAKANGKVGETNECHLSTGISLKG